MVSFADHYTKIPNYAASSTGLYINDALTKNNCCNGKNVETCNGLYIQLILPAWRPYSMWSMV